MIKHYSLFYLFPFLIAAMHAAIQWPEGQNLDNSSFNQQNTVIAFDVDGVLINRPIASLSSLKSIYIMSNHIVSIFCDATHKIALIKIIGQMLYDYPILKKHLSIYNGDRFIDWIIERYPELQQGTKSGVTIAEQLKKMVYNATPKPDTIALLKKLYQMDYPIAIATNQSHISFNRYVEQQMLPDFSYYIIAFTSDYERNENSSQLVLIKKPHKKYFKLFKEALSKKGYQPEQIVFIDDKEKNVYKATKKGIVGIQFKSVPQTVADLHLLGIM